MKKLSLLLLLAFVSPFLSADIIYSGSCGSYDYNLSVPTDSYTSAYCADDTLFVRYTGDDYYRIVIPDYDLTKIYTAQADTYKMYHQFDVSENNIKYIGSNSFREYMALAGMLSGFLVVLAILGAF